MKNGIPTLRELYDKVLTILLGKPGHQTLDRAVMKLYGFKKDMSEPDIVARLMEMYQKLTSKPTLIPEPEQKKTRKRRKTRGQE